MITETHKYLIQKVINVFETGTPEGKYDMLVVYPDGKGGSRQITYGRSQTTEQGNLSQLLIVRNVSKTKSLLIIGTSINYRL